MPWRPSRTATMASTSIGVGVKSAQTYEPEVIVLIPTGSHSRRGQQFRRQGRPSPALGPADCSTWVNNEGVGLTDLGSTEVEFATLGDRGRAWPQHRLRPAASCRDWAVAGGWREQRLLGGAVAAGGGGLIGLRLAGRGRRRFGGGRLGGGRALALGRLGHGTALAAGAAFIGHDSLAHGHRSLGILGDRQAIETLRGKQHFPGVRLKTM